MFRKFATAAFAAVALAGATLASTGTANANGYGYGHGYGWHGGYVVYTPVYVPTCHKYVTYDHYGNPVWVKSCH